jgi:hypothetical protein
MWVVIAGGVVLLIGLLVGAPGMAVPACIVAGIGGILYYQNATGDWGSWAYVWSLIPGFVGVGTILAGLLGQDFRQSVRSGLNLILISLIMFLFFAAVFWPIGHSGAVQGLPAGRSLFPVGPLVHRAGPDPLQEGIRCPVHSVGFCSGGLC